MATNTETKDVSNQDVAPPTLDVSKLHALPTEQQDLFLLSYVADLRAFANGISPQQLPAQQAALKKEVIKIVGLSAPASSRVVRHTLGQILADGYTRGSRQHLVESINDLLAFVNAGKNEKETSTRLTATTCLGYIYKSAGDSAISLHGLVISSLLKSIKASQSHNGYRATIIRALSQCIEGLGNSIDESIARDIWKQIRSLVSNDKSALVQKTCCICAVSLFQKTSYFLNLNDIDYFKALIWKVLESSVSATRTAAAKALALVLLQIYNESESKNAEVVPTIRKPKKSSKNKKEAGSDDEVEIERSDSASTNKVSTQVSMSLREILRTVSYHYVKATTSNKTRASLAICYKTIFENLPESTIQERYSDIATHFFNELVSFPSIAGMRVRLLLTRKVVNDLLNTFVGTTLLTENGQIFAARWLVNDVLKNYPQVIQGRREPSKHALGAALRALTVILSELGSAATVFQDSCREALFQVAAHPSYSVQVHVAACFRSFVQACPAQLERCMTQALSQLKKEIETADGRLFKRAPVYGLVIAAMLRSAREAPLAGSIETYSNVFAYASDLLKASATSELRLCALQVQIAWTLLGGLMTLGSNFVKVHLNQLLLLWRNALPAPLTSDNTSKRSQLELSFLAHVREAALAALSAFLEYNSNLITSDGTRRIATMLQNSIAFVDSLPSTRQTEDISNRLFPSQQLHDHAVNLRRRTLQCTITMLSLKNLDRNEVVLLSDIVGMSIRLFSDPARPLSRSVEASLASSASNFESIWELTNNWSYGINSMLDKFQLKFPSRGRTTILGSDDPSIDPLETSLAELGANPLMPALEHDSTVVFCGDTSSRPGETYSPETSCISLAIQLFSVALPLQPPRIQESCLEQVAGVLSQTLQREPGRKVALQLNCATAILGALAVANHETEFNVGKLAADIVGKSLAEIIRRGIVDHDASHRALSTQALGRLCYLSGNQFTNTEVKNLIDVIVANREPHVRAGCALALGTIHAQVGAMAASYHLKNIIGVLLSLCSDAHPTVHYWALKGLSEVAESAGLSFSAYASSTLGLLAQLYSSDHHNEESASSTTSAIEMDLETPVVIGQCVDSVINVLGPDLQDVAKARNLILNLVQYFQNETFPALTLQSYICLGHISLYAPAHVQLASYVHNLQGALQSRQTALEEIAIAGLENLVKRNAAEVFLVAQKGLPDELWMKLDKMHDHSGLKNILRMWMQQTCLTDTLFWIEQCQGILSKSRKKADLPEMASVSAKPKTALPDLADEDVAGLTAASGGADADKGDQSVTSQEYMRWQVRDLAMSLLSELLDIVHAEMLADQIIAAEQVLQSKVADIVRVAFLSSTAVVIELRVRGLHIFDQILKIFGRSPDPDFLEASLLEQYQAQISSALTPAFAADSNAELAAEAISVCATFVATGIVTNVDRMGRIFKVLSAGLDNLALDKPEPSIGDLTNLSWNAQSMLKMALLSGWAQLQLASTEQAFLESILQPYIPKLAPLWLSSLQEFAGLRFEPEISDTLGEFASNVLHERYSALDRDVRLVFYQKSWLSIVDAIALLVEKDSNAVFDALDGRQVTAESKVNDDGLAGKDMSFREEPVAFFFILFGLAYEALVTQARDNSIHALAILGALKRILTPAVSGSAVYQDAVFNETTDTLDRLALTSTTEVQGVLVQIARNLSLDHVVAKSEDRGEKLSDDVDQLFELTRIVILVLAGLIPTLEDPPNQNSRPLTEENINLVRLSFQALVDVVDVFPDVIRPDLYACIIHCYCTMLATGLCQNEVVPRIMPIFRSFLYHLVSSAKSSAEKTTNTRLVLGALKWMLATLAVAQRRENEFSVVCAKNTLLSLAILLTTASSTLPATDKLVTKAILELVDTLQDVGLAKISAGCARSLVCATSKTACDEAVARILWPRMLQFVMDVNADDPEIVKSHLMHSLVMSVPTLVNSDAKAAAITVLVPCLLARAEHKVPNGSTEDLAKGTASRLLDLAGIDPIAFRTTVARLEPSQRSQLEMLLRSAGVGKKQSNHRRTETGTSMPDEDSKPAIELRMDF